MDKIFRHNFVTPYEMINETVNGNRCYVTPTGEKYESVTTILKERTGEKQRILEWRKSVGEEEANKISRQASSRGTSVHKICEQYVLNDQEYMKKILPINLDTFSTIKPIIDENVDDIYGIELPLHSHLLKTAGRSDVIGKFAYIPSIIDFKTSRKPKKEEWVENYFIQATTYSIMFEEMYGIHIPQIVIIMAVDNEQPQLFVKKSKDYYNKVKEIFIDYYKN